MFPLQKLINKKIMSEKIKDENSSIPEIIEFVRSKDYKFLKE